MTLSAEAVLGLGYACFVIAWLLYLFHLRRSDDYLGRLATWVQLSGLVLWGAGCVWTVVEADGSPMTSLYVVLLLAAWACGAVLLAQDWVYGLRVHAPLVLVLVLAFGGVALFAVSSGAGSPGALHFLPRNPWLLSHYIVAIAGYAMLLASGTLGVLELLRPLLSRRVSAYGSFSERVTALVVRQNVRWALVVLAVAMLGGACWTWLSSGHYWTWTPVEIWMLVTWLIYGAYLHLGRFRGWSVAVAMGIVLVVSAVGSLGA